MASLTRESSPDGKPVPGQEEGVLSFADAGQRGRLPGILETCLFKGQATIRGGPVCGSADYGGALSLRILACTGRAGIPVKAKGYEPAE
ncbi:hypothetical protein MUK71_12380 [Arthrobacter zhangbolii]|uniref:Uncharacterized protein n=1 Tax=Arthrobacter zhangbolii TaxID=2886936 RepID=A0A9X1M859_9MICC|nr:hypothetical protein [Arthrobacter zhangbolii]MCC3272776.1 hypothetical protein [Arthrobacter zhangbolii]UON91389.1 hypothetical protein MUK71_12380 [Arthrobacter zhangbolii]